MDRIVNNIRLIGMKFDMCFKNIENMQFNGQICRICSNVNLFSESCSIVLQLSLQPNFVNFSPLNNILGPYVKKVQENFI